MWHDANFHKVRVKQHLINNENEACREGVQEPKSKIPFEHMKTIIFHVLHSAGLRIFGT